jgi:hypothetical protein
MRSQALEVYKIFERTYGEEDARVIIKYVEDVDTTVIERVIDSRVASLATKEELHIEVDELRKEMKDGFMTVEKGFQVLREEMKSVYVTKVELSGVKEELKAFIEDVRKNVAKDNFLMAVAQYIAIVGTLFLLLKFALEI